MNVYMLVAAISCPTGDTSNIGWIFIVGGIALAVMAVGLLFKLKNK